jgi:RNA polymerase sigma-70 factor (ECF subfamily)
LPVSPHFFRHESGRLVAALTRLFGVHRLALAEDVAQHAFCRALEVWKVRGIPDNPSAWLLATAKHRAFDVLRRERTARDFAPELARLEHGNQDLRDDIESAVEQAFLPSAIRDEQLRMMFSCCHPGLTGEAQIALILNILCGFGASEIANAVLVGRAAIEKRITRGKKVLAGKRSLFELSDAELETRLGAVHQALYLLFNEGYHGASPAGAIQPELCDEALRLTTLLCDYGPTATPSTHALLALMCLNAARLPARVDAAGDLLAFFEQDRSRWDEQLLSVGLEHFARSASGAELSTFHVEAAIAVAHASAVSFQDTDWTTIVALYDRRLSVAPSPVVALNRAIALGERDGPEAALRALAELEDLQRLRAYPFFHATLGELELRTENYRAAQTHFGVALGLARNDTERRFLQKRLLAASH